MSEKPTIIKDFPGQAVEEFRRTHGGNLPSGTPRADALHAKYLCEGQFTPDMPELAKTIYWNCIRELVAAERELADPDHNNPVKAWMADARTTTGNARESARRGFQHMNKDKADAVAQGTPRTDAEQGYALGGALMVRPEFARELERENAALSAQVVELQKALRSIVEGEFDDLDPDDGLHTTSARAVASNALKESNQSAP